MCGIFGYFPTHESQSLDSSSVLKCLRHRGPDDQGWLEVGRGVLGHTRLAILDLSVDGHQPMQDPTGRYSLVFNGEIYNFRELRDALMAEGVSFRSRSDTEVVLQGFAHWGKEVLQRLQGMFALAIYDAQTEKVLLARDRLGVKPLIYYLTPEKFVFASELKVLRQQKLVPDEWDPASLMSLLRFGAVSQPRTLLRDVQQLSPGHYLVIEAGGSHHQEPYCLPWKSLTQPWELDYDSTIPYLRERLEAATRAHLVGDVEVGCFLSGGVDSTAVLALMQREVPQPIQAFCLGFPEQQEVEDESSIAERSAAALRAKFHRVTVTDKMIVEHFTKFLQALDQPSIDGFNTYLVSQAASQHVKIVLSGLGGDEIFGGYPHFSLLANASVMRVKPWDRVARELHRYRPNRFTRKLNLRGRNVVEGLQQIRQVFNEREIGQMLQHTVPFSFPDYSVSSLSPLQNVSLAECTGYLRNTLLRDCDAVSMWHGLEVRPVLLDQNLFEFALRLPDDFKVRETRLKSIFVDALRDLLPQEVWQRPKTGFELPFARWMNGVLQPQILDLWQSESARSIFQPTFLKLLIDRTQRGRLHRRDWLLAVLVGWSELRTA
jgi:asparagine synthase (glutamine-hydrolysing)